MKISQIHITIDKKTAILLVMGMFLIGLAGGLFAPVVSHTAAEVMPGTFTGAYTFSGNVTIDGTLNASNVVGNGSQLEGVATLNGTQASYSAVGAAAEAWTYTGSVLCTAGQYVCGVAMVGGGGGANLGVYCCT